MCLKKLQMLPTANALNVIAVMFPKRQVWKPEDFLTSIEISPLCKCEKFVSCFHSLLEVEQDDLKIKYSAACGGNTFELVSLLHTEKNTKSLELINN